MTSTEVSGSPLTSPNGRLVGTRSLAQFFFGVPAVLGPLNRYLNWAKHMPAVIAYLIVLAAVLIVGCCAAGAWD
jgi:hypothetical protein